MKRIFIPLLGLLLLLASFGSAAMYSSPARASGGEEKAEGAAKISYIEMSPIILPIIDRDGISQTISIVISLQVGDPVKAEEVKHNLPKLADAYLSDMYGALSKKASMQGGVIKISMLKSRLKSITQKLMPEGGIDDVLLQVLQQHPV